MSDKSSYASAGGIPSYSPSGGSNSNQVGPYSHRCSCISLIEFKRLQGAYIPRPSYSREEYAYNFAPSPNNAVAPQPKPEVKKRTDISSYV